MSKNFVKPGQGGDNPGPPEVSEVAELERQVRLEKKKTLEAFQANVRIFQLSEKIRSGYEGMVRLAKAHSVDALMQEAVGLLCDPAGMDLREASIYIARDGILEFRASFPERPPVNVACGADHPLAAVYREEPHKQKDASCLVLPLKGERGIVGVMEIRSYDTEEIRSWQENILRVLGEYVGLMLEHLGGRPQ